MVKGEFPAAACMVLPMAFEVCGDVGAMENVRADGFTPRALRRLHHGSMS